jgi:hypothetical protein
MMIRKKTQWGLVSASIIFGIALIFGSLYISTKGYDYPLIVDIGFIILISGLMIISILFWDFIREKLKLKGRWWKRQK